MADACRSVISNWWTLDKTCENAGLLRDRFLRVAVKDKKNHPDARRDLFEAMRLAIAQSKDTYTAAYDRQEPALKDIKSKGFFRTAGRMVIGLGGENVLETGLTLNHTYGTPMIQGTALKGLASHYCDQAWGAADERFKREGEYHQAIFGTTDDSGHIIFHDAWITPESLEGSLQPDVMTPHHGDYYSEKGAPTDFDDPNPVTFLSIVGTFQVAVSCDVPGPDGDEWAKRVFELLSDALRTWGIGGKTNAGYGQLVLEERDERGVQSSIGAESKSTSLSDGFELQKPQKPIPPTVKKLKYKKGDTVEVTKVADPKEKRGASYFVADDGIGGLVVLGTPPSIDIGHKTRLEINGVMEKEGLYNFAAVGAKKEPTHQTRNKRGRR
jgi:CRISPR-associated protein Cmr6